MMTTSNTTTPAARLLAKVAEAEALVALDVNAMQLVGEDYACVVHPGRIAIEDVPRFLAVANRSFDIDLTYPEDYRLEYRWATVGPKNGYDEWYEFVQPGTPDAKPFTVLWLAQDFTMPEGYVPSRTLVPQLAAALRACIGALEAVERADDLDTAIGTAHTALSRAAAAMEGGE